MLRVVGLLKSFLSLIGGGTKSRQARGRRGSPPLRVRYQPGGMLEIDGWPFFGSSASPDGRFIAGASPMTPGGDGRWAGRCVLIDAASGRLLAKVRCPGARHAHVANTGRWILEDHGTTGALEGAVLAYDPAGAKLWKKSFRVAILDSRISDDGARVTVDLANGSCAAQSGKRYTLDGQTGKEISRE
jgi:hypothetical protein